MKILLWIEYYCNDDKYYVLNYRLEYDWSYVN